MNNFLFIMKKYLLLSLTYIPIACFSSPLLFLEVSSLHIPWVIALMNRDIFHAEWSDELIEVSLMRYCELAFIGRIEDIATCRNRSLSIKSSIAKRSEIVLLILQNLTTEALFPE